MLINALNFPLMHSKLQFKNSSNCCLISKKCRFFMFMLIFILHRYLDKNSLFSDFLCSNFVCIDTWSFCKYYSLIQLIPRLLIYAIKKYSYQLVDVHFSLAVCNVGIIWKLLAVQEESSIWVHDYCLVINNFLGVSVYRYCTLNY